MRFIRRQFSSRCDYCHLQVVTETLCSSLLPSHPQPTGPEPRLCTRVCECPVVCRAVWQQPGVGGERGEVRAAPEPPGRPPRAASSRLRGSHQVTTSPRGPSAPVAVAVQYFSPLGTRDSGQGCTLCAQKLGSQAQGVSPPESCPLTFSELVFPVVWLTLHYSPSPHPHF